MPRSWTVAEVADVVANHPEWGASWGSSPGDTVLAGTGESYEAWRSGELLLRVARRPVGELPVATEVEYAALRLAPEGLAPHPIALGENEFDGLIYPWLAESVVPGHMLAPAAWTDGLRARLAADLARLHERTWPGPGSVPEADRLGPGRLDSGAEVEHVIDWWAPRLAAPEREAWEPFVAPMRAYGREMGPLFADLDTFALVHGDTVLTNILVHEGSPRLVDWEWARIGDPARDLAFAGGRVHADPWYASLSDAEIDTYLRAYADSGGRGDLASLRARRDFWLAAEAFAVLAYLLWTVAGDPGADHGWRPAAARTLLRTLPHGIPTG
ncbi:MAG: aminoglycoside phosphotransferase family protein [Dermatophilaceae bacterium]